METVHRCSCGTALQWVVNEDGRGVYECSQCPLIEWRSCLRCQAVTICFPKRTILCQSCTNLEFIAVAIVGGEGSCTAEEAISLRESPSVFAMSAAEAIRDRARRRLGLSSRARVPRKIEDAAAAVMRGAGCLFIDGRWTLPNSVALASCHYPVS